MIDKEKEAIDTLFHLEHINGYVDLYKEHDVIIKSDVLLKWKNATKTVLNLIQTQQIKLENKDKIIDEMANELSDMHFCTNRKDCNIYKATRSDCKECIKQYFEYKVEEDK